MPNLTIEDRLLHYFLAMGAEQTESAKIPYRNLVFVSGSDRTCVLILKNEEILQRNRVIEVILSLASLRNSAQLLYLAAPRLLGASLDAGIFRNHGIGLLLFDDRRIDEALAPQLMAPRHEPVSVTNVPSELTSELIVLKSMYAEMERNIAKLRDDLETFRRADRHTTYEPSSVLMQPQPTPSYVNSDPSGASLPTFLVNNPWLEVLSKRGRPGRDAIAG